MHKKRRWCVTAVASTEALARALTEQTWTLCSGFYVAGHEGYLFLNDATHEDGAAEYAVVKGGLGDTEHVQVESITFSWCSYDAALRHIRAALAGEDDRNDFACPVRPILETPAAHGRCHLCA
jgi:hypothetical protein